MIQVLGLRDFTDDKGTRKREQFFGKGWRFESIEQIFNPELLDPLIEKIPANERYNLYFTVADCFEESGRKLREQWAIPFDIDELDLPDGKELEAAEIAARAGAEALNLPFGELGVTFSGNGVQFFVATKDPILSEDYFEQTREHYGVLAKRIQTKLLEKGIQGKVDASVWSKARLMRLPGTENRKPGKPHRTAKILNGHIVRQDFDVVTASGLTEIEIQPHVSDQVLKNYPKPDTKSVCEGCEFLKHCKAAPEKVSEPEWYAMVSITARLENGRELTHQMSEGHPSYNHYETENKIDQSLAAAGPRTCKNIDSLWGQCHTCAYVDKVTSPIMIKGEDYIASGDFGYRERRMAKDGTIKPGKPAYIDLVRTFMLENPYKVVAENSLIFLYDGRKWVQHPERLVHAWTMNRVRPEPSVTEMNEFLGILKGFNVVPQDWFLKQSSSLIPFKNVVYNRVTKQTMPHSPEHGFFYTLGFDYDPRATAPRWAQFILEIAGGNTEIAKLLEEYAGYCISNDECWAQKALFLVGEGANGKSVFMEVLGAVAGREAHAAVPIQDLEKDTTRHRLVNKLFNYSEETSIRALQDSSTFKTVVNGGVMQVKQLYVQPYEVENRAKMILSANEGPKSSDMSYGFYRRLMLVNLKRQFIPGNEGYDPFLKAKLLLELPGICNRVMEAYERVKETQVFSALQEQHDNIEQLKTETDTVRMFIEDHVEDAPDDQYVLFAELYEAYKHASETHGYRPFNLARFAHQFFRNKPDLHDKRDRLRLAGKQQRVIRGIKMNKGDF